MGSVCSCFDVEDPLDNTQTANNANNDNRIIPNLYNKVKQFAFSNQVTTHSSPQVASNAVIILGNNTQSAATTTTSTTDQCLPDPLLPEKKIEGHYLYPSSMEKEECPTCLEEYTAENPKITTKCCHNFHLPCIYEWLERNSNCPVCDKVMSFSDL